MVLNILFSIFFIVLVYGILKIQTKKQVKPIKVRVRK